MADTQSRGEQLQAIASWFDHRGDVLEGLSKLSDHDSYSYYGAGLPQESIETLLAATKTVTNTNASLSKFLGDMASYAAVVRLVQKQYAARATKELAKEAEEKDSQAVVA